MLIVLSLVVRLSRQPRQRTADGARGPRHRPGGARHHPDRRRRRHGGRHAEHLRNFLRSDPATDRHQRREPVGAAAADRHHQHHPRHGHADGQRLRPDRLAAGALHHQAGRRTHGGAYVRHVFRHAVDDHPAGGDRRLCRRQHCPRARLGRRLGRRGGGLEHVLHPVPVRHRTEHADERHLDDDRVESHPQHPGHLRRHRRRSSVLPSRR